MHLQIDEVENAPLKPLTRHRWLRSGTQTKLKHRDALRIVEEVRSKATDFHSLVGAVQSVIEALRKRNQTTFSKEYMQRRFRRETVQDFFNGRQYFACGGQTIVACALFRALGVPAKYVERLYKDGTFSGHVVAKIRHPSGKWVYFDPTKALLAKTNRAAKVVRGKETIRFREGLDSHDIGIETGQALKAECAKLKARFENCQRLRT